MDQMLSKKPGHVKLGGHWMYGSPAKTWLAMCYRHPVHSWRISKPENSLTTVKKLISGVSHQALSVLLRCGPVGWDDTDMKGRRSSANATLVKLYGKDYVLTL